MQSTTDQALTTGAQNRFPIAHLKILPSLQLCTFVDVRITGFTVCPSILAQPENLNNLTFKDNKARLLQKYQKYVQAVDCNGPG